MFTRGSGVVWIEETASVGTGRKLRVFLIGVAIICAAVFVMLRVVPRLSRSFYHSQMEKKFGEELRVFERELPEWEATARHPAVAPEPSRQDPAGLLEGEVDIYKDIIEHTKLRIKYRREICAYHSHWSMVNLRAAIRFWEPPPLESAPPPRPEITPHYVF
jgi:hypothetical protein